MTSCVRTYMLNSPQRLDMVHSIVHFLTNSCMGCVTRAKVSSLRFGIHSQVRAMKLDSTVLVATDILNSLKRGQYMVMITWAWDYDLNF